MTEKQRRLAAISTPEGLIAAVAMDQRRSLRQMIARACGVPFESIGDERLAEFKSAVSEVLTPHASAVLLDPEYGLDAAGKRAAGCGLLLTYESDGFENPRPHRMLQLMPGFTADHLRELGADAVKILLSWAPDGDEAANSRKRAMVTEIGNECESAGMPFLLEPVLYDPAGASMATVDFARKKPALVTRMVEEFSKPEYKVDVLKIEFPVLVRFVRGSEVFAGEAAQTHADALQSFRAVDQAARVPYIFLSAGAPIQDFLASLRLAHESGAQFSGVLCGRAMWQDGIPHYAQGGDAAFREWLGSEGVANAQAIRRALTPTS